MKNASRILTAVLLGALLAVSATAAETSAETAAKVAEPIPVVAEGMKPLPVTSSLADSGEDTAVLFDNDTATSLDLTFDEEAETKTFTLRMASGIPQPLSAVALVTSSGEGGVLTVRIWGTNDSTEKEWTPLSFHAPVVKTGEWNIFNLTEPEGGWQNAEKFAFYRLELTVEEASSFTLSECLLIRPDLGEPELVYETVDAVDEGQTPPVTAVEAESAEETEPAIADEEAPALPRRLRFGLFFPGIMK